VARKILKLQKHGVHAEDRILVAPRLRPAPEQPIFEGAAAQGPEAGIHAGGICLDQGHAGRVGSCDDARGDIPKSMHPESPVLGQKRRPEQCGQFPGGGPPHQVHLEEAILAVQVPERPSQVGPIGAGEGGNACSVALDGHGALRPGSTARPSRAGRLARRMSHAATAEASTMAPNTPRMRRECARVIARDFSNRRPDVHIHAAGRRRVLSLR